VADVGQTTELELSLDPREIRAAHMALMMVAELIRDLRENGDDEDLVLPDGRTITAGESCAMKFEVALITAGWDL
jgi:hypothetical protein